MDSLKIKLESGAELEIWLAGFPEGHRLYKAVSRTMSNFNLAEGNAENLALLISSSEDIDEALWPCMAYATYKLPDAQAGIRITPAMFEKAETRADLIVIQREVLGFNLIPFSKSIGSLLKAALSLDIAILKSK